MKEQMEKILELFKTNVTDEDAEEFVQEMIMFRKDENIITSEQLAEAVVGLIFDPLDTDNVKIN